MTTEAMQLVPVDVYCFITSGGDGSYRINWRLTEEAANEAIDNEEIEGDGDGRWRIEKVETYVGSNVWNEANEKETEQKVDMWFESFHNPNRYREGDSTGVKDSFGNEWDYCSFWGLDDIRLGRYGGNTDYKSLPLDEFFSYPFIPHLKSRKFSSN